MSGHIVSNQTPPAGEHFRSRLRRELAARCTRNPRYSLRAFANFLAIDHASLSQMMRGTRACSAASIRRLGARVGLNATEIGRYVATAEAARKAGETAGEYRNLAADASKVLGNWSAFAILELMRLAEFRPDVRWIARVLGIDADEVNINLQHLIRLGFLQMKAPDHWLDLTGGALHREEHFTLLVLERLAKRSLDAQLASARNAPDAPRFHGSLTLAVDEQELAGLIASSERLLASLGKEKIRGNESGRNQLYHVEVHCFPISTLTVKPSKGE